MCMMLYIGSDRELPLIDWQDGCVFSVRKLLPNDSYGDSLFATENLKKPHKYQLGSWQGCGCGFSFDYDKFGYEEDNLLGKQSLAALFDYLRANIGGGDFELLSFWSGEWICEPGEILRLSDLSDSVFGEKSFYFAEGEIVQVVA